jgi:heavy metal transport/detoxification protein
MQSTYTVTGMTCGHCVNHVTEEVSAIAGVSDVQVSLDDARMVITSEAPIALETITQAVSEAGDYTVSPV